MSGKKCKAARKALQQLRDDPKRLVELSEMLKSGGQDVRREVGDVVVEFLKKQQVK